MFFRRRQFILSASLSARAWRKFIRNPLGAGALIFVGLVTLVALLGYLITPDPTPFANRQCLEISLEKPGFSTWFLKLHKTEPPEKPSLLIKMISGAPDRYDHIPVTEYRFTRDSILFRTYDPETQDEKFQSVARKGVADVAEKRFWLGTDRFGRDYLSQLMIGTRVSLAVGFIAVFISLLIGITVGAIGGYFRGRIDDLIVWFINVIWSIPTLLLVIAITFALGKGFWQVFVAVGLTMWVEVARVVRGQILSIREKEFVEAARALGFSNFRIIFRHILPNVMAAVIVISSANFASAILLESGLSFLGLGVQPPVPSWGSMLRENYGYIVLDHAYLAILPGVAIMLMVLAFMLIGNTLRDSLDVRTSEL